MLLPVCGRRSGRAGSADLRAVAHAQRSCGSVLVSGCNSSLACRCTTSLLFISFFLSSQRSFSVSCSSLVFGLIFWALLVCLCLPVGSLSHIGIFPNIPTTQGDLTLPWVSHFLPSSSRICFPLLPSPLKILSASPWVPNSLKQWVFFHLYPALSRSVLGRS